MCDHGSSSWRSRSRWTYQSTDRPRAAMAAVQRSRSKHSDHSWKVPPARHTSSMTAPMRRSPLLAMPSARVARGSCQRRVTPLSRRVASRNRPMRRRRDSTVSWPNHWNGVWGLGTNPPTEAVTLADLLWARPMAAHRRASSAMPRVSSSLSVGNPVRKYSLTRRHPWENADSTAPYRSSSVMSLLITRRMRHVPASGAKVRPVRRTFWISLATATVKASTRRLGRLTDT